MTEPGRNLRFRILFGFLAVVTCVSLVIAGWALYARFTETNAIRASNNHVWHAVVCEIEHAIIVKDHLTVAQEKAALRFWDHLLVADVGTVGCGLV